MNVPISNVRVEVARATADDPMLYHRGELTDTLASRSDRRAAQSHWPAFT